MKARKLTKVGQVKNILKTNPNATTAEVAKLLNIKEGYAGTLLWKARGGKKKKLTPVNKSEVAYKASKGAKTKRVGDRHEYVNGAQVLVSNDIEKLQAEVFKLNDWCIQWSNTVKETESKYGKEISRLKFVVCDKDAIISYLEDKLVQVLAKSV